MILANKSQIARFIGESAYDNGASIDESAARINRFLVNQTGDKVPCYASRIGKRGAIVWVSVGSSCRISRGEAQRMISTCGGDLEQIEIWWDFGA